MEVVEDQLEQLSDAFDEVVNSKSEIEENYRIREQIFADKKLELEEQLRVEKKKNTTNMTSKCENTEGRNTEGEHANESDSVKGANVKKQHQHVVYQSKQER